MNVSVRDYDPIVREVRAKAREALEDLARVVRCARRAAREDEQEMWWGLALQYARKRLSAEARLRLLGAMR